MGRPKYHNWISYGQNGLVAEITIKDENGSKLETFRINVSDKKATRKVVRILKEKYGFDFSSEFSKKDQDLDWLK